MCISLFENQKTALKQMHDGCILCGGTGVGKSITALSYFYISMGGILNTLRMTNPTDLYIITTAKKRDSKDWDVEAIPFRFDTYPMKYIVDSWNNIDKYKNVKGAFFIFDEQRVVGKGVWVKDFIKISEHNRWILLSATPGDTWNDYIPVFIANGFYKNRTEFNNYHVIYDNYVDYPKIKGYVNTRILEQYRNSILVPMEREIEHIRHDIPIIVNYDKESYREIMKTRWDPWRNEPFQNASTLCYGLRKIVNSDKSRELAIIDILKSISES